MQPAASTPDQRPRRDALSPLIAMAALLPLLTLSACATFRPMTPRADLPPPQQRAAPATAGVVARQLEVRGPQGRRLGAQERLALLRRVGAQGGSPGLMQHHLAAMAAMAEATSPQGPVELHADNEVRLLIDGPATFAAMFQAIEQARETVLLESYIIEHAAIAQQLAALLKRKRAQGVRVAMIYDALGSLGTDAAYFDELVAGGIAVCPFNPLNPVRRPGYWDITHRDHRKILVVDNQLAFTGGINISEVYSRGSFGSRGGGRRGGDKGADAGWRDTQIQLRGGAARALEALLRETWASQGCPDALPPPAAAAPPRAAGAQLVRIVPSTPQEEHNPIYTLLLGAVDAAQRSVHLTMAYFAPGSEMVDALCEAAQRGVDVQLVLPSISDFSPVLHAGRSYYQRLLAAGVRIHELQDAVLHAKTAVIDGVVSTVGSSNMDWRSFAGNNEVNAVVIGEDFGREMERMFRADLAASRAIDPAAWQRRPLWQRAREQLARLFERWW